MDCRDRSVSAEMGKSYVFASCFIAIAILPFSTSLPFVVLHGLGDQCRNGGITHFTNFLSNYTGQEGFCIEIGDGSRDSWFTSMTSQVESACGMVKSLPELQSGYNLVGLSQGNVIGRGVIQWCDDGPPVNNMISLGGPHAGTASIPLCGSGTFCGIANLLIELGVYTPYVQEHLGPAGYVKIPTLNNELEDEKNTTHKERFSSLNQLVLIMFENDKVLIPPETAWFGYYASNNLKTVVAANETDLYQEDWIGLRALDEAGKVSWVSVPGGHLRITEAEMITHIVPYLVDPIEPS